MLNTEPQYQQHQHLKSQIQISYDAVKKQQIQTNDLNESLDWA